MGKLGNRLGGLHIFVRHRMPETTVGKAPVSSGFGIEEAVGGNYVGGGTV